MDSFFKKIRTYRQASKLPLTSTFKGGHTQNTETIAQAKKLHAKIYLHRGYISASDLGEDQTLSLHKDPYQEHSQYFVVRDHNEPNKPVVATARQIYSHPEQGHQSFPTLKELTLYPEMKKTILALDPEKCVEISGLAKDHGIDSAAAMALYRSLWHHSLRRGHHVWLMACDAKVYGNLKFLFGDALVRIGDNSYYMGSEVVPAMLEVHRSIDPLLVGSKSINPFKRKMKKSLAKFFMHGLSVKFHELQKKPQQARYELAKTKEVNQV